MFSNFQLWVQRANFVPISKIFTCMVLQKTPFSNWHGTLISGSGMQIITELIGKKILSTFLSKNHVSNNFKESLRWFEYVLIFIYKIFPVNGTTTMKTKIIESLINSTVGLTPPYTIHYTFVFAGSLLLYTLHFILYTFILLLLIARLYTK